MIYPDSIFLGVVLSEDLEDVYDMEIDRLHRDDINTFKIPMDCLET